MEYLETTDGKNLDDILAESKGRYGASNLIMFITAEELHKASEKIYANFPGIDVIPSCSDMAQLIRKEQCWSYLISIPLITLFNSASSTDSVQIP